MVNTTQLTECSIKRHAWDRASKGARMHEQTTKSLEQLAREDPEIALLALLYRDAVASFDDPRWSESNPDLTIPTPIGQIPTLHDQTINLDVQAYLQLMEQMVETAALKRSFPEIIDLIRKIDLPLFAKAVIEWDIVAIDHMMNDPAISPATMLTLGGCALLPQMNALRRHGTTEFSTDKWDRGYCPICGSWPVLGEQRGLEKQLWLRCGRCFCEWRSRHQLCIFCGNADHQRLGYMAAEDERESRRISICHECHGSLKVIATVSPLSPGGLLQRDLQSLELDVAAADEGYTRPEQPGCSFTIHVNGMFSTNRSWLPWR
jgi:FdhE protein